MTVIHDYDVAFITRNLAGSFESFLLKNIQPLQQINLLHEYAMNFVFKNNWSNACIQHFLKSNQEK